MRRPAVLAGCVVLLAGLHSPAAAATGETAAEAYRQGQERLARRTVEDLRGALRDFERAAAADPTFAPAFAGLAETHALLYDYPRAREAALKAVALDARLATAHAVLGFVLLHADWDWAGAGKELRRALELEPQRATPHLWHAILLEATGRPEEAVAEARRAAEIAPREAPTRAGLGYRLYWARHYDEAVAELTAALEIDRTLETAHYFIGRARVQQGRFDEAYEAFARAKELSPRDANLDSARAYLEAVAGRRNQAEKILSDLERLALRNLPFCSQVAGIRAALGDKEAALGWLELAHSRHEGAMVWLKIDPRFDSLRGEPRFIEILQRMGLAEKPAP